MTLPTNFLPIDALERTASHSDDTVATLSILRQLRPKVWRYCVRQTHIAHFFGRSLNVEAMRVQNSIEKTVLTRKIDESIVF